MTSCNRFCTESATAASNIPDIRCCRAESADKSADGLAHETVIATREAESADKSAGGLAHETVIATREAESANESVSDLPDIRYEIIGAGSAN